MVLRILAIFLCMFELFSASVNAERMEAQLESRLMDIEDRLRQLTGIIEQIQYNIDQQSAENKKVHQDISIRFDEIKASLLELTESLKKPAHPGNEAAKKPASASVNKDSAAQDAGKEGTTTAQKADKEESNKLIADTINEIKALMTQGEYKNAQARAKQTMAKLGNSSGTQMLHYWLGEAYYAGKSYSDASLAYVKGYKISPNSAKSPELLYKLSKALTMMGKKQDAKITLDKLLADYKDLSPRLRKLASQDRLKIK